MFMKKDIGDMSNVKIKSIIGQDVVIEGNFYARESTRIDGQVMGYVCIDGALVRGSGSRISGNVAASSIMTGGQIDGDLTAKDKIVIASTGKVTGNMWTKKLVIDENAVFQGQCFMGDQEMARDAVTQPAAPRQPDADSKER